MKSLMTLIFEEEDEECGCENDDCENCGDDEE
jgi:hypothetical protein